MSRRTREARRIFLLKQLMEKNNGLSPEILTAVAVADTQTDAYGIAGIFEEATGKDLPFPLDEWYLTVRVPVELYFVFERKKDQQRFIRQMKRDFPGVEVIY